MLVDTIAKTLSWFKKAVPNPASKNFHTQLGCHFEEVNEMLMVVETHDFETQILIDAAKMSLHALSMHLKTHDNVVFVAPVDREEYLDSLCDQIVTAVGCGYMSDLDICGGLTEVNRSNFSKFDDSGEPIFDPNMKLMKSNNYEKAELAPFI